LPTTTPSRKQIALFAVALCIAAFELGSFVYFTRVSQDFIEAANVRSVPVYRLGEPISWQGQAPGAIFGWWAAGPHGTWSVGSPAAFEVRLVERPVSDLVLRVWANAFLAEHSLPVREVDVFANGMMVARWQFTLAGPHVSMARIPRVVLADDRLRIEFHFAKTPSPVELGVSADYRRLGLRLLGWRIEPEAR
jgi:hypothetical protein